MERKLRFVEDELLIRPYRESDKDYIMSTWLHTYRNSSRCWHLAAKEYFWYESKRMEFLLENQDVAVLCAPKHPDVILGWICYKPTKDSIILHYIVIKEEFQGRGLGTAFLKAICNEVLGHEDIVNLPLIYTYSNKKGHGIRRGWYSRYGCPWRFNPYIVDGLLPTIWGANPDVL